MFCFARYCAQLRPQRTFIRQRDPFVVTGGVHSRKYVEEVFVDVERKSVGGVNPAEAEQACGGEERDALQNAICLNG